MELSGDVKKTILYFLERHFTDTSDLHTLELGISSATPLFVSRSRSHVCVIDGTNGDGPRVSDWLREHGAHTAEVRLIESLYSAPLTQSLDIVLLGECGRPALLPGVVDALLPALRAGAILILPGLAQHSRHELLCALLEHDDFYGAMTLEDVAFVSCYAHADTRRTLLSALDAERYPAFEPQAYVVPHPLPWALEFGGYETARPAELVRGFRMSAGRPVTEGRHAMVTVPVEPSTATRLSVDIVVAPVCRDQRTDASVTVEIGPVKHDTHQFADDTDVTFSAEIERPEDGNVTIKLWSAGLMEARHLENPPAGSAPYSRPGLELKSVRIGVAGTADTAAPFCRTMKRQAVSPLELFVGMRHSPLIDGAFSLDAFAATARVALNG